MRNLSLEELRSILKNFLEEAPTENLANIGTFLRDCHQIPCTKSMYGIRLSKILNINPYTYERKSTQQQLRGLKDHVSTPKGKKDLSAIRKIPRLNARLYNLKKLEHRYSSRNYSPGGLSPKARIDALGASDGGSNPPVLI